MYVYLMQSAFCYVFVCVRAHVCVCVRSRTFMCWKTERPVSDRQVPFKNICLVPCLWTGYVTENMTEVKTTLIL